MLGEYSGDKARGVQLWRDFGPRAVRFFAAAVFVRDTGCLPPAWDWAAQYLALKPPALFDGHFGAERTDHPASPAPGSQNHPPGASKPAIRLLAALHPALDEISRRRRRPPIQQSSPGATTIPAPLPTQPSASQHRGGHRGDETPKKSPDPRSVDEARANIPEFKASYRLNSPSHTLRTPPSYEDARERYIRSRSEFRPSSSYCGNSGAPSRRPSNLTLDRRNSWIRGWPKKWEFFLRCKRRILLPTRIIRPAHALRISCGPAYFRPVFTSLAFYFLRHTRTRVFPVELGAVRTGCQPCTVGFLLVPTIDPRIADLFFP